MKEKKPCLTFTISNSTLLAKDNRQHEYWIHPAEESEKELQEWIKQNGIYEIVCPLPEKPQLYVVKYYGENDLRVYRTRDSFATSEFPDRLTVTQVTERYLMNQPGLSVEKYDTEIFYGSPFEKSEGWNLFYKFAWLQDLLFSINSISHEKNKEVQRWEEFIPLYTMNIMRENFPDEIALFLRTIRDYPDTLENPDARKIFIDLVEYAKHGGAWHLRHCTENEGAPYEQGRKESKKMIELFRDNFIPKDNQGDLDKLKLAECLMIKFTDHLRSRSSNQLGKSIKGKNNPKTGERRTLADDQYDELMKWARKNNEASIVALSRQNISDLFLVKPEKYITDLLAKGFDVDPKTISRKHGS